MLRIFLALLILSSCSMGTVKTGGERTYAYDVNSSYTSEDLKEMSSQMVQTSYRDPRTGKIQDLFGKNQPPLKRVGIIVFETRIQPTYDGLAGKNMIYMSEAGKQILSENLLRIWEESVKILAPEMDYVTSLQMKKATSFRQYGSNEEDFVKTRRSNLAPDDIFFLESGKKTTTTTIVNPRGMQDVSFLLVPATELMDGPKWSEHNKHFLNDVAKELKLDAAIIVMSDLSWTAAHTDKHSGEVIPEEIKVEINASTLIPLSGYHQRLENIKISDKPGVTLCFRSYESELKVPALISAPEEMKNFKTIETELLTPMLKTYKDLSQMTLMRITDDLKKTW